MAWCIGVGSWWVIATESVMLGYLFIVFMARRGVPAMDWKDAAFVAGVSGLCVFWCVARVRRLHRCERAFAAMPVHQKQVMIMGPLALAAALAIVILGAVISG